MKDYIESRVLKEAEFILGTKSTVRKTAKEFCVSKSTVHKDVTERLDGIDKDMKEKVKKILDENLSERHIRGGIATKKKFEEKKTKFV